MERDTDGRPADQHAPSLMQVLFTLGSRWIVYNGHSDVLQERDIKFYTESTNRSGGGPVGRIDRLDDYNYVVYFLNHRDAVNVVRRKTHTVKGWSLTAFLCDTQSRSVYSGHQYIAWQGSRANIDHKENIKSVDSAAGRTVLVTGHFSDTLTSDSILALLQNLGRERCSKESIQFVEPASLAFVQFQLPDVAQNVASMVQKDLEATRFHLFIYRGVYVAEPDDDPDYTTSLMGAPGSPVTLRCGRTTEHRSPDASSVTRATVSATSVSTVTSSATSPAMSSTPLAESRRTESQQEAPFEVTLRDARPSGRLNTSRSIRSPLARGIDPHEPLQGAGAHGDLCLLPIEADGPKAAVNETTMSADPAMEGLSDAQAIQAQSCPQTESTACTKEQVEAIIISHLNRLQEQTRSSFNLKQNQMKAETNKLKSTVVQLQSEVDHLKGELQSQKKEIQNLKFLLDVKNRLNVKTTEAFEEEIAAMRAELQNFRDEFDKQHALLSLRGSNLSVANPSYSSSDSQRSSNTSSV